MSLWEQDMALWSDAAKIDIKAAGLPPAPYNREVYSGWFFGGCYNRSIPDPCKRMAFLARMHSILAKPRALLLMILLSAVVSIAAPPCYADATDATACACAVALTPGQPAPCTGILVPEDDARDLVRLRDLEPDYLATIDDLTARLTLCLSAPAPVPVAEPTPWWRSPVFWGVVGGGVGLLLGGGVAIYVGLAVR